MRSRIAILFIAVLGACGRSEEPRSSRGGETTHLPSSPEPALPKSPPPAASEASTDRPPPAPTNAAPAATCVVPTPEVPPKAARPAARCPPDPQAPPELPRGYVTFVDAPGSPRIEVELAREPQHRARGLMYRTRMPSDHGMLFSWAAEEVQTFWMRNTCLPLDMLFVAKDGTITGILEQVPTMNDEPRSIPCPVLHVLEVDAGFCRSHAVRAGQRLKIET